MDTTDVTATAGDNSFMYTSPELMEGLTLVVLISLKLQAETRASGTGLVLTYTGIEGLTT